MSFRRRVNTGLALAALALVSAARPASPHETVNTTVLFDREIVRILNSHCVMCHADGGPSFPLETYEQAWLERRKMSAAVIIRHMPPWPALAGYGHFKNENVVTLGGSVPTEAAHRTAVSLAENTVGVRQVIDRLTVSASTTTTTTTTTTVPTTPPLVVPQQ